MNSSKRRRRRSMSIWPWVKQLTKIRTPPGARLPAVTICSFSWMVTALSSVICVTNTTAWIVESPITAVKLARSMKSHTKRIRMMKSSWSLSMDRNLNSARSATTGCKSHMDAIKWSAVAAEASATFVVVTTTNAIAQRVIAERRGTSKTRINPLPRNEYL